MHPRELKRIRTTLGLSQEGLARQLQVAMNTVARWERGIHPISNLTAAHIRLLAEIAKKKEETPA